MGCRNGCTNDYNVVQSQQADISLSTNERPTLRRSLGLVDAVGIGLGAIIGAGIFVVTGVAAGIAGPAFLIGLLLAGVVATFNALSSAQLAATYPQSGGTYEYGYQVLHPWLDFTAGWMFLASKLAAGGTVALGFTGYLHALFPAIPERPTAIIAILVLAMEMHSLKPAALPHVLEDVLHTVCREHLAIQGGKNER